MGSWNLTAVRVECPVCCQGVVLASGAQARNPFPSAPLHCPPHRALPPSSLQCPALASQNCHAPALPTMPRHAPALPTTPHAPLRPAGIDRTGSQVGLAATQTQPLTSTLAGPSHRMLEKQVHHEPIGWAVRRVVRCWSRPISQEQSIAVVPGDHLQVEGECSPGEAWE